MARGSLSKNIRFEKGGNDFYIITNGSQTEKNYFECFQEKYKTPFNVKVIPYVVDPLKLVKYSERYLEDPDLNQIWCIFDIDSCLNNDQNVREAYLEAAKYGIKICYSNPAFEVWLLHHYCMLPQALEPNKLIPKINDCFAKAHSKAHYEKNEKELLKKYFIPRYEKAVENESKQYIDVLKQLRSAGDTTTPFWKISNTSDVFRVIDALLMRPSVE